MCSALRLACDCPLGVSWLKSLLPCIRPAAFQVLCPWRSRVNVLVWVVGEGGVGAIGAAIGAGGRFILIYSEGEMPVDDPPECSTRASKLTSDGQHKGPSHGPQPITQARIA